MKKVQERLQLIDKIRQKTYSGGIAIYQGNWEMVIPFFKIKDKSKKINPSADGKVKSASGGKVKDKR
ncbi:MAG: hypothetical protein HXX13_18230 [Bacteroidetes bacterium]|nr:hypothetical protein [Bacteroidota bacterium]